VLSIRIVKIKINRIGLSLLPFSNSKAEKLNRYPINKTKPIAIEYVPTILLVLLKYSKVPLPTLNPTSGILIMLGSTKE